MINKYRQAIVIGETQVFLFETDKDGWPGRVLCSCEIGDLLVDFINQKFTDPIWTEVEKKFDVLRNRISLDSSGDGLIISSGRIQTCLLSIAETLIEMDLACEVKMGVLNVCIRHCDALEQAVGSGSILRKDALLRESEELYQEIMGLRDLQLQLVKWIQNMSYANKKRSTFKSNADYLELFFQSSPEQTAKMNFESTYWVVQKSAGGEIHGKPIEYIFRQIILDEDGKLTSVTIENDKELRESLGIKPQEEGKREICLAHFVDQADRLILLDFMECMKRKKRIVICPSCGKAFLTEDLRSVYCKNGKCGSPSGRVKTSIRKTRETDVYYAKAMSVKERLRSRAIRYENSNEPSQVLKYTNDDYSDWVINVYQPAVKEYKRIKSEPISEEKRDQAGKQLLQDICRGTDLKFDEL